MPSNDPEYQKRYIRKHYQENKQYYKDKAKERNKILKPKLKAFANRYKLWKGCIDCGYKEEAIALQFDHIRDKHKDVSLLIADCASLSTVKNEIRKCEVRCANCHAIITQERRRALSS